MAILSLLKLMGGSVFGTLWNFLISPVGRCVALAAVSFVLGMCTTSKHHAKREAREVAKVAQATAKETTRLLNTDLIDLEKLRIERSRMETELKDAKDRIAKGSPASRQICPAAGAVVSCEFDASVRDDINAILSGRKTSRGDTSAVRPGVPRDPNTDEGRELQGVRDRDSRSGGWLSGLSEFWKNAAGASDAKSGGQAK